MTITCEAWHRRINNMLWIGKHHPSLFVPLDHLQEEVAVIHQDIEKAEAGHFPPKKKKNYQF